MKKLPEFKLDDTIYSLKDLDSILTDVKVVKTSKKVQYLNVSVSFDIETTSFYRNTITGDIQVEQPILRKGKKVIPNPNYEKCNTMYAWVFGFNGKHIIGRTWNEFNYIIDSLHSKYSLSKDKRIIIYIHNLAYEFQYLSKRYEWDLVFALDKREPVKAVTTSGIEFRCSYLLSGYSLAFLGERMLHKYKVQKMVGDLDYSLLRHTKTPLTEKELGYILHDGMVVSAYIQEKIEEYKNITRIPLTKTGAVRRFCRKKCLGTYKTNLREVHNFKRLIHSINVSGVDEYKQLKRAFHGGFTHANAFRVNKVFTDVGSFDFTSSYPAVMLMEKYPMSKAYETTISSHEEFLYYLKYYCCIFDIRITNLRMKDNVFENPLSFNKCFDSKNAIVNNGRVVSADEVLTTLTNVDFEVIRNFYEWDKISIYNFRYYYKGYLPKPFILAIIEMYKNKTKLKDVEGEEVVYMNSKENLNACFGMSVTDICKDEVTFKNGVWGITEVDYNKVIEHYNNAVGRFLCYQWGVFVTAYAMKNLFTGIYEFKDDYIYSDTDSIKGTNINKHMNYINRYNDSVRKKLYKMCDYYNIDYSEVEPETIEGKKKLIGVWDYEGKYNKFKTLGAKRYLVEKESGELKLTCSGLNKKVTTPYLKETYKTNEEVFKHFNNKLYIPKGKTGKNIHSYIDYEQKGTFKDYLGNVGRFHEIGSIHMESSDYSLSLSYDFINYLFDIEEKYYN